MYEINQKPRLRIRGEAGWFKALFALMRQNPAELYINTIIANQKTLAFFDSGFIIYSLKKSLNSSPEEAGDPITGVNHFSSQ